MKVKELMKILEKDGWNQTRMRGSHRSTGILNKQERLLWLERQVQIYHQAPWRASSSRLV
jgi:hypothetical protein